MVRDESGGTYNINILQVTVSFACVYDHDFPLFAIYHVCKHLRSALSQPGCYIVLYVNSLMTSASFPIPFFLFSFNVFTFSSNGPEIVLTL